MLPDPIDSEALRAVTPAESALSRRIDLTTLRLFIAICEEQNLTKAASREGIAASAVSKRMNDFELSFGVTLFKRLSKGMSLTPAGEALLHHARVTLLNVEKIASNSRNILVCVLRRRIVRYGNTIGRHGQVRAERRSAEICYPSRGGQHVVRCSKSRA